MSPTGFFLPKPKSPELLPATVHGKDIVSSGNIALYVSGRMVCASKIPQDPASLFNVVPYQPVMIRPSCGAIGDEKIRKRHPYFPVGSSICPSCPCQLMKTGYRVIILLYSFNCLDVNSSVSPPEYRSSRPGVVGSRRYGSSLSPSII